MTAALLKAKPKTITDRIDAITELPADRQFASIPAPKSCKIELSSQCNYRCGFCSLRTRQVQGNEHMDFELFKRISDDLVRSGVEEIGLFYLGESMTAPDLLIKATQWCKQALDVPYVFLTTNGSLAFPEVVKPLMEAGLDSLKFSINATPEQFSTVMGVKSSLYQQALDNLKEARLIRDENGYKCGIFASSIQFDGEQAAKMEDFLNRYIRPWVDQHYFLPLYGMAYRADEMEREFGYRPTHGNMGRIGALRKPLPCWSAFQEAHVRVHGELSVCCFGADDRFDVGDLSKQTFMEAWNSPKFQEIRQKQLDTMMHGSEALRGTMCEVCCAY